jgi:hypothetical protein
MSLNEPCKESEVEWKVESVKGIHRYTNKRDGYLPAAASSRVKSVGLVIPQYLTHYLTWNEVVNVGRYEAGD